MARRGGGSRRRLGRIRPTWFTRSEVEALITDGIVSDAKSVAGYALLLLRESTPRPAP